MACERCSSLAWQRPIQPVVIGGCHHHPRCPCVLEAQAALAPVRRTPAGMGLASLASPDGSPRVLRIDAGGSLADVRVTPIELGGAPAMRLELVAGGWAAGRGFARGVLEVDRPTYDRAIARAEEHGGLPRLMDLLQRRGLAAAVSIDTTRPILGRGDE